MSARRTKVARGKMMLGRQKRNEVDILGFGTSERFDGQGFWYRRFRC